VEVDDGPAGSRVAACLGALGGPEATAQQVQELVDGVGGQVRGDAVAGADRPGGVGPVDDQVVGGPAGPGGGRPADLPDLGLGVGTGLAQGLGEPGGRLGQPGVEGGRVVAGADRRGRGPAAPAR
jgi:hypothetical protein